MGLCLKKKFVAWGIIVILFWGEMFERHIAFDFPLNQFLASWFSSLVYFRQEFFYQCLSAHLQGKLFVLFVAEQHLGIIWLFCYKWL